MPTNTHFDAWQARLDQLDAGSRDDWQIKHQAKTGRPIVFESLGIFERWKETGNLEGEACECSVIGDDQTWMTRRPVPQARS